MKKSYFLYFKIALLSILLALTSTNPFIIHADNDVIDFNWPSDDIKVYTATEQEYKPTPNKDHIELAYIESTGTQYIDLHIGANLIKDIDTSFVFSQLPSDGIYSGVFTNAIKGSNYLQYNSSSLKLYGNAVSYGLGNISVGVKYRATYPVTSTGVARLYSNGLEIKNVAVSSANGETNSMYLFDLNYNGSPSTTHYVKVKCYSYIAHGLDDSALLNLIPVITINDLEADKNVDQTNPISKNTVCLYNTVNEKYYTNGGTGNLVAGPPVTTLLDGNKYGILEYLESTGTQYIDTDFKPGNATKVIMDYEFVNTTQTSLAMVCGVRESSEQKGRYYPVSLNNTDPKNERYVKGTSQVNKVHSSVQRHKIIFNDNNKVYVDGAEAGTLTATLNPSVLHRSFWIFGANSESADHWYSKARIYSLKMYEAQTSLVRDFIPVLKYDTGELGLYDLKNDDFYPRSGGTGDFKYGVSTDFYSIIDSNTDTSHAADINNYNTIVELTDLGKYFFDDSNLSHTWSIEKNKFIDPVHDYIGTYNGKEHTVSIDSTINNQIGDDITTNTKILFSDDNGLTYTLANPPKYKKVGTYTVYYKITPINNPDKYDVLESTAKVIIRKAKITIPRTGVK